MGIFKTIVAVAFAVAVTLFAVSNRNPVTIELWPLPYAVAIDLYAAVLLAVLVGFIAGIIGAWMAGGAKRRAYREASKRVRDLERGLAEAKTESEALKSRLTMPPPAKPQTP